MTVCEVCGNAISVSIVALDSVRVPGGRVAPVWLHDNLTELHAARPAPELPLGEQEGTHSDASR